MTRRVAGVSAGGRWWGGGVGGSPPSARRPFTPIGGGARRWGGRWGGGTPPVCSKLAGLDVDGHAISPSDFGEQRAAEIGPGGVERHVVVDGDGHGAGVRK